MLIEFVVNPGTRDFPELAKDLPVSGEIRELPDGIAERLIKAHVAVKSGPSKESSANVSGVKPVRAIPSEPKIASKEERPK